MGSGGEAIFDRRFNSKAHPDQNRRSYGKTTTSMGMTKPNGSLQFLLRFQVQRREGSGTLEDNLFYSGVFMFFSHATIGLF